MTDTDIDAEIEELRAERERLLNDGFDDTTGTFDAKNVGKYGEFTHEYADIQHKAAKTIQKVSRGSSVRRNSLHSQHKQHKRHGHKSHPQHLRHHTRRHHQHSRDDDDAAATKIQSLHRGNSARKLSQPLKKTKSGWLVSYRGTRQRWYKVYLDRELSQMESKRNREVSYTTGDDELLSACPDLCRMLGLCPCIFLSCVCPDPSHPSDRDGNRACCSSCQCCCCC